MRKHSLAVTVIISLLFLFGCGPSYKVKPVSFKTPDALGNAAMAGGATMSARAFINPAQAKEAFGFDIIKAGMLPVQVVFDNQGSNQLEINSSQTFLIDAEGSLWPVLSNKIAYERATKYAETNAMFKEGAQKGALGALAGAVIGAAIGIATDEGVASSAGKGAAVGAAAGATMGGAGVYGSGKARRDIIDDLHEKSLQGGFIEPMSISHGIIFFPGEADSALKLRIQLVEVTSGQVHVVTMQLAQN